MGKGDRKTAKGKRFNSSYGNVRQRARIGKLHAAPVSAPAGTSSNKTVVKRTVLKKAAS